MARKRKIAQEDILEKKKQFEQIAGNLEIISVEKFLKDNFLPYAWSYNLDRALVDVTGLKPVQRRIAYSMYKDGLSPGGNRSKVATLAGRVLAYHPHGNASVEDALKNMGRDHVFRVPIIDGKGDYGAPGSPGAAARYIEARLNKAGWINVEEIGEHAVRMVPSYDGHNTEPLKIPVRWPVSLINGGSGIAIAYASNMPSHNPTEIMKACKALLRNPETTHAALSKIILGPDFNLGGVITTNDGIKDYLATGNGSFKIRGSYDIVDRPRGATRIEFNEIPFGTFPEKILQEIQKQMEGKAGRFKDLQSYKDLSDLRHPVRLIFDTKPGVNYKRTLAELFSYTSLESSFSVNMTTIVDNKPKQSSMKDLILDFIEFRKECVRNKLSYLRTKKAERFHLVEGLLRTLIDIDAAIAIIRKSEDAEAASQALQKKFKIDDKQAQHVLALQLRRLTKMDKAALDQESAELQSDMNYIQSVLTDDEVLKEYLLKEFDETAKIIGDERHTEIIGQTAEEFAAAEKEVSKELRVADKNTPAVLTRFANGTIHRSDAGFSYSQGETNLENGPIVEQLKVKTQEEVVLIGSDGIGRRIPVGYLLENSASTAAKAGVELPKGVTLVGLAKAVAAKSDVGIALMTKNGSIKISKTDFAKGEEFPVITLDEGDEVIDARWLGKTLSNTWFWAASKAGNILIFDAATIRPAGSKAGGVRGMKLKDETDAVVGFGWMQNPKTEFFLSQADKHSLKLTMAAMIPTKNKGGMGVLLQGFNKGETALTQVAASVNLALAIEKTNRAIDLPPATPRAAKGVVFSGRVAMGSIEVTAL